MPRKGISQEPPSIQGLRGRYSPLGYPEYTVPDRLAGQYLGSGINGRTLPPGVSYYSESAANNPETMTHERIHQGQFQLPNQPTIEQLYQALSGVHESPQALLDLADGDPRKVSLEAPAYEFEDPPKSGSDPSINRLPAGIRQVTAKQYDAWGRKQQEAYDRYIDLMYRLNGSKSNAVEMAAPSEYERNYVGMHPRPYLPPDPKMKEVNIFTGK